MTSTVVYAKNIETGTVQSLTPDLLDDLIASGMCVELNESDTRQADPRVLGKADPAVEKVRDWGIGPDGEVVKFGGDVQWAGWSE